MRERESSFNRPVGRRRLCISLCTNRVGALGESDVLVFAVATAEGGNRHAGRAVSHGCQVLRFLIASTYISAVAIHPRTRVCARTSCVAQLEPLCSKL
jgi:hypothetical protein